MSKKEYRNRADNPNNTNGTSSDLLKEISEKLGALNKSVDDGLAGHKVVLDDHETRLKKLEEACKKSAAEASPKEETQKTEPKAPASGQAQESKVASSKEEPKTDGGCCGSYRGPGRGYKYWDYESRSCRICSDIWAAKQASGGCYDPIWVWYEAGEIHHVLSNDEIRRYIP